MTGAVLTGFRIIGDAATPLGVGVIVRTAELDVSDLDISGALTAAIQYERGGTGALLASRLHDNPGAAIVVRAGAAPRILHNTLTRNATSERAPGSVLVEADASPTIDQNVFQAQRPESVIVPPAFDAVAMKRSNFFIDVPPERRAAPAARPARGRR